VNNITLTRTNVGSGRDYITVEVETDDGSRIVRGYLTMSEYAYLITGRNNVALRDKPPSD